MEEWKQKADAFMFPVYPRFPFVVSHAEGCYIYDTEGNAYLDCIGGIGVNALGYGYPKLLRAIEEQQKKYMHLSNLFYQIPQIELAERLIALSGLRRVFFTNSGSEAVEAALKLARRWGAQHGKVDIIGFSNGFHGRTYGPLSVMWQARYREQMGPFLPNTLVLPYNDTAALRQMINQQTAAVILEIVQGAGGLHAATADFLSTMKELQSDYDFLIIVDEVQTAFGRVGEWFAFQQESLFPDIVTTAKIIGGGLPLGAMIAGEKVAECWAIGHHGSTFGGNAVACAAGLVVLQELEEWLLDHVRSVATPLRRAFEEFQRDFPELIAEVRGRGLMLGFVFRNGVKKFQQYALEEKILVNITAGNVVRFLPPLIFSKSEMEVLLEKLRRLLQKIQNRLL